ncbi:MAG: AAA family ATPase [Crocinitomicaceae bacterium]
MKNRIVITGGGGSGKSSVIQSLMEKGLCVFEEQSRQIIKQSLLNNSETLPWKDIIGFSYLVQDAMINDYQKAPKSDLCFFDRSLCDIMAYLEKDNIEVYPALQEAISTYRYNESVFIMPPWQEIFENDIERVESFEASVHAFEQLKETYEKNGYTMIEIPKGKIEERVDFILREIAKFKI